jgi:hypothetical protein
VYSFWLEKSLVFLGGGYEGIEVSGLQLLSNAPIRILDEAIK